jgi:hypothetical protein
MMRVMAGVVLADIGEIVMGLPFAKNRRAMAVIVLFRPMKLGITVFGEVML